MPPTDLVPPNTNRDLKEYQLADIFSTWRHINSHQGSSLTRATCHFCIICISCIIFVLFVLVVFVVLVGAYGRDPVFCTFYWGTWQISGTLEHFHTSYFAFQAILIKWGKNYCPWNEYISLLSTTANWSVKVGKVHQKFCTQAWLHIQAQYAVPRSTLFSDAHNT